MSVQRSPPVSGSHPNLTMLTDEASNKNVSIRKRKTPDCEVFMYNEFRQELAASLAGFRRELKESLLEFQQVMMSSFKDLMNEQNENIHKIQQQLNVFKSECSEIKQSVDCLHEQQANLRSDISMLKLETENTNINVNRLKEDLNSIKFLAATLSERLHLKEQEGRKNNLEITGVPFSKNENLYNILHQISVKVGFSLSSEDIDYVHRVRRFHPQAKPGEEAGQAAKSSFIPNIIVRLTQRKRKCELLAAVRARRGITTADLNFDGASLPVFINDHLSPQNKLLYRQVRDKGRKLGYKYIWINDCKIFVRKNETSKAIVISIDNDLDKIK